MNIEATKSKLSEMKLLGMLRGFELILENKSDSLTTDEAVAMLVDAEFEDRFDRRLRRLLKTAKLKIDAVIEEIDFRKTRNLLKADIVRLASCEFIPKGTGIVITGATGVGKSYIACALAHKACMNGYKVKYFNCMKLFSELKLAKADGSYKRFINKIQRQDLIVFDDFGLQPLDAHTRIFLLEILEDRHGRKSTIVCSQLPPEKWHEVIGEPTVADAICDRIIHSSVKFNLKGESMRKILSSKGGSNLPPQKTN